MRDWSMAEPPPELLLDKICFVIHRACVEIRMMLQEGNLDQAMDLADAVEHVPCYLPCWNDEFFPIIVDSFRNYQNKYNNKVFDYVGLLLMDPETYQREFLGRWRGDN
jgi:hypothetical protein